EDARGQRRQLGRVPLIQMKAPALHHERHPFERAGDELALVPRRPGLRETGDLAVRHAHRVGHGVRDRTEARSEHDRNTGPELAEPPGHRARCLLDHTLPPSLVPLLRHNRIPASVADRKFASVPAIMARNPSRARSCFRSGTSAPMPPIWMPTELIFAKPHSANVAIVNDTGSRAAFICPSCT